MAMFKTPVVVFCAWTAAMCGFVYEYDQGLVNVTMIIDTFLHKFPEVDIDQNSRAAFFKGLVTAIFELGAVVGALQSAFVCDRYSRRYTILLACFWYLIGSAIQAGSQNYAMLVAGRFIGGIGVGGASMVAPLYISEIAPPHIRGALLTLQQWMLILGIVAAYYTTYGSRHIEGNWAWQTAFVAQILPGLILTGIVAILPFSPRWLGIQGREEEGLKVLSKLRALPIEDGRIQAEWLNIRTEVLLQERISGISNSEVETFGKAFSNQMKKWMMCFDKYFKRVLIGITIHAFQQWVGVNGFTYYLTTLFQKLGYDDEERLMLGGLLSVVQLVGAAVPILIIDRLGRRPLLLIGTFIMMSCHIINASVIGASNGDWANHQPAAKAGTGFMFIFMFFFEISWGPIAWGLPSEILPSIVRAEGVALATSSNWFSNFIVGLCVPAIVQAAPYGSFALFSGTSFLALVWVYFVVPETKQQTIESLSVILGDSIGSEEADARAEIVDDLLQARGSTTAA
ncbi:unnamed protein product [Clonostachys rosea]|uniref:Major facilitator superfamily (MFS) profile domain-containing protein n=1 Tax=Bionectria ochroleuca TaxID=29856 RepID=A0ABY6U942_BIOOC|nr:unnamed protein product [Clonostachys rosea]